MEPSSSKQYLAVFLDSDSRALLLRWWNHEVFVPLLPNVVADHVTLVYDPTPEDLVGVAVGEACSLLVTGWAEDASGQAVAVTGHFKSKNMIPHVTIATAHDVESFYANELLARGIAPAKGPLLRGIIDLRQE